jgi:Tfp pilus assembly protein PilO
MKLFKNRYQEILFKTHFLYFLANFILFLAIIFTITFGIKKAIENNEKVNSLKEEIKTLTEKQNNLYLLKNANLDFEKTLKIFNQLIPEEEDYFSIIYALETLSQKTGFQITSYAVNLSESSPGRLRLLVSGTGSTDSFLNFLKEYNFGGKRLITSNNLSLSPQQSEFKIELSFYSKKKVAVESSSFIIPPTFPKEVEKIMAKTEFTLKEGSQEASFNLNYPRKQNPFSLE